MINEAGMIIEDGNREVNICFLDQDNNLIFTTEFLTLTKDLPNRRAFACQLASWWNIDHVSSLLDYFGPADQEDVYSGIDGDAMGLDPNICDLMEYKDVAVPGLPAKWYQDILKAKLVSIKLPEKLIKEYVDAAKKTKGV